MSRAASLFWIVALFFIICFFIVWFTLILADIFTYNQSLNTIQLSATSTQVDAIVPLSYPDYIELTEPVLDYKG